MSTGIKKTKIENLSEKDILSSLSLSRADALNKIVNSSRPEQLRRTVYLSSGGKYYKYVDYLLKFAYDLGYVPIHPILTLNYYISSISHDNDKGEIVKDCFSLMENCTELWVFEEKKPSFGLDTEDISKKHITKYPEGVLAEIAWWKRYKGDNPIRFFTWKDIGIPKYLPKNTWKLIPEESIMGIPEDDNPSRFGIIDLGSSTIKLSIIESKELGNTEILFKKSVTTNLAEDFFDTKTIKKEAMDRTIQALKDLKDEGVTHGVNDFKLIGTKVIRDASNSDLFIQQIKEDVGLTLKILSKEEELELIKKAVTESFTSKDVDLVIINAGGGSSQISYVVAGETFNYSLPVGISDLNERFLLEYPISKELYKEMKNYIKDIITREIKSIPGKDTIVYTGGELDYMLITGFPLEEYTNSISHPKQISVKEFKRRCSEMRELSLSDIQSFMPSNPNWMNGAIASNTLLEVLCELFKIKTIIPSNKNINDGIVATMQ